MKAWFFKASATLGSLRIRMALLLVALLAIVQLAAFAMVNRASYNGARIRINDELVVGQHLVEHMLQKYSDAQLLSVSLMSSDYAFRRAIAIEDGTALADRMRENAERIHADIIQVVDLNGNVIADTKHPVVLPRPLGRQGVLEIAATRGSLTWFDVVGNVVLEFVVVPVHSPHIIGYVVAGFALDQRMSAELHRLTGLDISFGFERDGQWQLPVSSLPAPQVRDVLSRLPPYRQAVHASELTTPTQVYQTRLIPLDTRDERHVVAILQRPVLDAMAGFRALRSMLVILGLISVLVSLVGSLVIALGITRPLAALMEAVRRIRRGDYAVPIHVHRRDEIGALARGLEHMRQRIAEREQSIMKLAYEDPLTQLPNRSQFAQRLKRGIERAQARGQTLAIFVMDLDRFKYVNDSLGHGVGDYVLREVASRLRHEMSEADCIARLGGDEFALLVADRTVQEVMGLAERVISALERPIFYDEQPLDIGASIGVAFYPAHATDSETLVRNADIAMYVAKRNKSGFAVYDPRYDTTQQEHLSLLGELRRAIEHGELMLHYQPQIRIASSGIIGAEALIRWNHPTRGLVPPDEFIPFAEQTGYIKVLTRWILQEAISQCARWREQGLAVQISVNISARDLMYRELPEMVAALLHEHGLEPSRLCLELTESGYMEDPANSLRVLERLSAIGVRLSIDDYGTGYSSLSYLMKLPVDELKIDRSFVMRLTEDGDLMSIVRSTIELARSLGLQVVAEGVESGSSLKLLRSMGCNSAQGYFIARPMPPEAFCDWVLQALSSAQDSAIEPDAARLVG